MMEFVADYATLGEISELLRAVFREHEPSTRL
jgi:hypothetical protein